LNDYDTRIKNIEARINDYGTAIAHLQEQIDHIGNTQLVWNVTKGEYTDSKTALRDLYRELAVYGARVTQIADINVANWPSIEPTKRQQSATLPYSTIIHRASLTRPPANNTRVSMKG
jgi:hypothetical protein